MLVLCVGLLISPAKAAYKWLPVDPGELAAKASTIDPDADSEVLHHFVTIDDAIRDASTEEYVRIKIFSEKGVHRYDKVDIRYKSRERIKEIQARIIKPDGSITDLDPASFFSRDFIKTDRGRSRLHSFSFPGLSPGCIIEYKYIVNSDVNYFALMLRFMDKVPTRHIEYRVRPLGISGSVIQTLSKGNFEPVRKLDRDGWFTLTLSNLPALKEEKDMPPKDEVQPWLLLYPSMKKDTKESFWNDAGKELNSRAVDLTRRSKNLGDTSKSITKDASPNDQLRAIYDYCLSTIQNTGLDADSPRQKDSSKPKENKSLSDVLERNYGSGYEITALFVGLARAAGFDARMTYCSNRGERFFDYSYMVQSAISDPIAVVRINDQWQFFDPASGYCLYGELDWEHQNTPALIMPDKGNGEWAVTPLSTAAQNCRSHIGMFYLDADGTLEGDVRMEYTGQFASNLRHKYDGASKEKQEKLIMEARKDDMLPGTEITKLDISGLWRRGKSAVINFHIRIPNFAEVTARRVFINPAYFQRGGEVRYIAQERTHDIWFHYPWSERSKISIILPEDYALEQASTLQSLPKDEGLNYRASLLMRPAARELIYTRSFELYRTSFPASSYALVKQLFELVHEQDALSVTLQRVEAEPSAIP